ncbi:hypothetical protein R3P38DRAFT_2772268 [Favolaschia claudopus]|uniref:Uncharacterized protein n=1 Tax=Favolaschia claudopus TaxID=2862362 RepID=A0AAW0C7C0_9AGAR
MVLAMPNVLRRESCCLAFDIGSQTVHQETAPRGGRTTGRMWDYSFCKPLLGHVECIGLPPVGWSHPFSGKRAESRRGRVETRRKDIDGFEFCGALPTTTNKADKRQTSAASVVNDVPCPRALFASFQALPRSPEFKLQFSGYNGGQVYLQSLLAYWSFQGKYLQLPKAKACSEVSEIGPNWAQAGSSAHPKSSRSKSFGNNLMALDTIPNRSRVDHIIGQQNAYEAQSGFGSHSSLKLGSGCTVKIDVQQLANNSVEGIQTVNSM